MYQCIIYKYLNAGLFGFFGVCIRIRHASYRKFFRPYNVYVIKQTPFTHKMYVLFDVNAALTARALFHKIYRLIPSKNSDLRSSNSLKRIRSAEFSPFDILYKHPFDTRNR